MRITVIFFLNYYRESRRKPNRGVEYSNRDSIFNYVINKVRSTFTEIYIITLLFTVTK
jgi:hypothetical protein